MILKILWFLVFTQVVILLDRVNMGHIPFLPQVCPIFTPNFLISKNH